MIKKEPSAVPHKLSASKVQNYVKIGLSRLLLSKR